MHSLQTLLEGGVAYKTWTVRRSIDAVAPSTYRLVGARKPGALREELGRLNHSLRVVDVRDAFYLWTPQPHPKSALNAYARVGAANRTFGDVWLLRRIIPPALLSTHPAPLCRLTPGIRQTYCWYFLRTPLRLYHHLFTSSRIPHLFHLEDVRARAGVPGYAWNLLGISSTSWRGGHDITDAGQWHSTLPRFYATPTRAYPSILL